MVTSGQVASIARSFRSRATRRISGDTPWAENRSVAPSGTSVSSLTNGHAALAEVAHDVLVVHDLVVDVDRRPERPERKLQRLDRHVDAGTKTTRARQENLHVSMIFGRATAAQRESGSRTSRLPPYFALRRSRCVSRSSTGVFLCDG